MNELFKPPVQDIIDAYNAVCPQAGMPKARLTKMARAKLRTRWQEKDFREGYAVLFQQAAASSFLTGKTTNWRANFGWLIHSESNYTKVLDGNYDEQERQTEDYAAGF